MQFFAIGQKLLYFISTVFNSTKNNFSPGKSVVYKACVLQHLKNIELG